jgi:hypothetical protein
MKEYNIFQNAPILAEFYITACPQTLLDVFYATIIIQSKGEVLTCQAQRLNGETFGKEERKLSSGKPLLSLLYFFFCLPEELPLTFSSS